MIEDIIIQAGGKGTRLEHLTFNKPKCIVSVNNLPILFYAFQKFPNARFRIISDYKSEVLEKYLKVFAKDYNYQIIKTSQTGTVSGIKDALNTIDAGKPFMIMWSDIVLSDNFCFPEKRENFIGISKDFDCRWSYINNQFEKIPSKENGVAGLFIFKDKDQLNDIGDSGALVRYLSQKDIKFERLNLYGSKEVGTLISYDESCTGAPKCRPFNKMSFDNDYVIKTPITRQGELIAADELAWYKHIKKLNYNYIPEILDYEPLKMKRIDGKNIFEYSNLSKKQKEVILQKIVASLKKLHSLVSEEKVSESCVIENYFEKTFDRINLVKNLIPFAKDEFIKINGSFYKNPFFMQEEILSKVKTIIPKAFSLIHGDCNFSNIMLDTFNDEVVLIDPIGYFGKTKLYGDKNYDWAKLYYSLIGNYDQFNRKNFVLEINQEDVNLEIKSNGWECMRNEFLQLLDKSEIDSIQFIHAIIWLSLTTYAWDDYDSICGAFYNGVMHLNKSLDKNILELSSLPHTWLLDIDGTLVEHNGHLEGKDKWLKGAKEFLKSIDEKDKVIILTSRNEVYKGALEEFLADNSIKYDEIIFGLPFGERILINDNKPSGLRMAYAIDKKRDSDMNIDIKVNNAF